MFRLILTVTLLALASSAPVSSKAAKELAETYFTILRGMINAPGYPNQITKQTFKDIVLKSGYVPLIDQKLEAQLRTSDSNVLAGQADFQAFLDESTRRYGVTVIDLNNAFATVQGYEDVQLQLQNALRKIH